MQHLANILADKSRTHIRNTGTARPRDTRPNQCANCGAAGANSYSTSTIKYDTYTTPHSISGIDTFSNCICRTNRPNV